MLANLEIHSTIPATNLDRARKFYAEKLGFTPESEMPEGLIRLGELYCWRDH
jgi:catechol 2,3-dioxygenase-like lactoylglutathione lyase family enzyme